MQQNLSKTTLRCLKWLLLAKEMVYWIKKLKSGIDASASFRKDETDHMAVKTHSNHILWSVQLTAKLIIHCVVIVITLFVNPVILFNNCVIILCHIRLVTDYIFETDQAAFRETYKILARPLRQLLRMTHCSETLSCDSTSTLREYINVNKSKKKCSLHYKDA